MITVVANPSRPVQVLHGCQWVSGWLEAYRREPAGWRGMVRYSPHPGAQYLQWWPAHQLRAASASRDQSTRVLRRTHLDGAEPSSPNSHRYPSELAPGARRRLQPALRPRPCRQGTRSGAGSVLARLRADTPEWTAMNSRMLGLGAALLAVLFVILNFVVDDAGTLFLILAVVAAAAAGYFLTRDR